MKTIFRFQWVAIATLLGVASCKQNESIEATPTTQAVKVTVPDKFIQFNGTTVRLPGSASEKLFLLENHKEIMQFAVAEVQKSSANARTSAEDFISKIPGTTIMEILQKEAGKYPKLDFSKEQLEEGMLERITKDFPDIKTQKEAIDKSEIIAQYYDKLLRDDLIKGLKKIHLEGLRPNGIQELSLPGGFAWIAVIYPITANTVWNNKGLADIMTDIFMGGNVDGTQSNAFRHAVWNAFSVSGMRETGFSRNSSLEDVKNVTSAYESVHVGPSWAAGSFSGYVSFLGDLVIEQSRAENNAMDLNNNLVGRTFMYNNMGFWPWQKPTTEEISLEMQSKANSIGSTSTMNLILTTYDSNTNEAWNRLYGWHYDDVYRDLVKLN